MLALAFFFAPALAAVAGVRAPSIENHQLGRLPTQHDGWGAFAVFDLWATDHLPLRNVAISANTNVERGVFGENPAYGANGTTTTATTTGVGGISAPQPGSPNASGAAVPDIPTVVSGTDGWLYYGSDFRNACEPVQSADVTVQRLARLADIMKRAGKTFVMFIPPDKSDVYLEHVPANAPGAACAAKAQAALWAALAANPPSGYQDLHGAILTAKRQAPDTLLYRKLDTHWNDRGGLIYAHLLADSLDPRIWPTTTVTPTGDQSMNTDLKTLLGLTGKEQAASFKVTRPGVVLTNGSAARLTNTTTNAPLIAGPTLFISDSFTEASRFAINPFFENAGFINSSAADSAFDELTASIRGSKVVVLEIVERDIVGGQAPILRSDVLDRLALTLGEG